MSYLPHDGTEFIGDVRPDALDTADDAIRVVMTEQKREVSRKSLPEIAPDDTPEMPFPPPRTRTRQTGYHPRREPRQWILAKPLKLLGRVAEPVLSRLPIGRGRDADMRKAAPRRSKAAPAGARASVWDRVSSYRPTRQHIFWVVVAGIMIWRPWLLPLVLVVTFSVAVIAYLSVGPDRVTELVADRWMKLALKRPELAERIRGRADAIVVKTGAILDVLPGKWTDRIALPDLSQSLEARLADEESRVDPFDRLASDVQKG